MKKNKTDLQTSKRGRSTAKINMGTTVKTEVIKTIVDCVLINKEYDKYMEIFSQVNWMDLRQATKAFRKLIEIIRIRDGGITMQKK